MEIDMDYVVSDFNGFECREFSLDGRAVKLVIPKKRDPLGRWLIKTEYFGAFPAFEISMLERGFHVAYVKNITRWMVPSDIEAKEKLAAFLAKEYGLNEKCVPVGMSCGGLQAVYFAAAHPERIAALYLDAPVLNLLSCPMGIGKKENDSMLDEMLSATGLTVTELINYRNHPIDKKEKLLAAGIPIFMVYGDADVVVPYEENGLVLESFYRQNGGIIETVGKAGCGHHPHSLPDNTPIIEFVLKYYV
jgi:pimeloyl-ACP methyl ester carboxylesterase